MTRVSYSKVSLARRVSANLIHRAATVTAAAVLGAGIKFREQQHSNCKLLKRM